MLFVWGFFCYDLVCLRICLMGSVGCEICRKSWCFSCCDYEFGGVFFCLYIFLCWDFEVVVVFSWFFSGEISCVFLFFIIVVWKYDVFIFVFLLGRCLFMLFMRGFVVCLVVGYIYVEFFFFKMWVFYGGCMSKRVNFCFYCGVVFIF